MRLTQRALTTIVFYGFLSVLSSPTATAQETEWRPIAEIGEAELTVIEYARGIPAERAIAHARMFRTGNGFVALRLKNGTTAYYGTGEIRIASQEEYTNPDITISAKSSSQQTNIWNFLDAWGQKSNPNMLSQAELDTADTLMRIAVANIPVETDQGAIFDTVTVAARRGNRYHAELEKVLPNLSPEIQGEFYKEYGYSFIGFFVNSARSEDQPSKHDVANAIKKLAEINQGLGKTLPHEYLFKDWLAENDQALLAELVAKGLIGEETK